MLSLIPIIAGIVTSQNVFEPHSEPVYGVNIGGWLVAEPWITPTLFETHDVADEYSLGMKLGPDSARQYLKKHWDSFYNEADFLRIASWGINLVRIPIGYWAFDPNPAPYVKGAAEYLDKAVVWARKANLKVLIDLHGAPGSQNGFDNSGRAGRATWQPSDPRTPEVIRMITARYHKDSDTVIGIEVLNEPAPWALNLSLPQIATYFDAAYKEVRKISPSNEAGSIAVWFHDSFTNYAKWNNTFLQPNYQKLILDTHHYEVFNPPTVNASVECHIAGVCNAGKVAAIYSQTNLPVVFGEWAGALTDCTKYLNGYKKGTRFEGTLDEVNNIKYGSCKEATVPIAKWSKKRRIDTRRFIEAQLVILFSYF